MLYGIIDIGSNTIRLTIYRVENGRFEILFSEKVSAGLASFVTDGKMPLEGIHRASEALCGFKKLLGNLSVERVSAFATASLRNVSNTDEAVRKIETSTGFSVEVLSGEEEARLDFAGAMASVDVQDGVLADIGGGSTELVAFENRAIKTALSLPIGSLSLHQKFVRKILPSGPEFRTMKTEIRKQSEDADLFAGAFPVICGVGGTARAVLRISNYLFSLPAANTTVASAQLRHLYQVLKTGDQVARNLILKTCPERIHTVLPGLLILREVVRRYDGKTLVVSRYGVREGYLAERVIRAKGEHGENGRA